MSPQMAARPNQSYQQVPPYVSHSAYYDAREPQLQQATMYLQDNQHPYIANGHMYQQHTPPIYSYQQEYQQYPTMLANPPFSGNFAMRTAVARGGSNIDTSTLLKQSTNSELSVCVFYVYFYHRSK